MNDYERQRAEKIARNKALLEQLNVQSITPKQSPLKTQRKTPKPVTPALPARASARLAARPSPPKYVVDKDFYKAIPNTRRPTRVRRGQDLIDLEVEKQNTVGFGNDEDDELELHSELVSGWIIWEPSEPEPIRDENCVFHFDSHPNFVPNKAPWEVMCEGAFGGTFWRKYHSLRLGLTIADDWHELPTTWLHGINPAKQLTKSEYDASVNKYRVRAGQTIEEWESNGWIDHRFDLRGWFQWYCRYFQGRRCEDDDRQISRWVKCAGENGRWRRTLLKKYVLAGIRSVTDEEDDDIEGVSPVIHQTLHHWAFEIRQNVLDEYWAQKAM
jgi:hypothetical protein